MIPLAVVVALALAAGPSDSPRRTGLDVSNVARAKAGLLPRKVTRAPAGVRGGHRLVRASAPTFLAEPAPLAEDAPAVERADEPDERLVAARGPVVVTVQRGPVPVGAPPPAEEPVRATVLAPEEIGAVRAAALGVVTEVTISLRFEP